MPGAARWIENIAAYNGREITIMNPEMIISSDAFLIGWDGELPAKVHPLKGLGERGEIPTHKCTRIEGSGSCTKTFHQGQSNQSNSHANRQYMRPTIMCTNNEKTGK